MSSAASRRPQSAGQSVGQSASQSVSQSSKKSASVDAQPSSQQLSQNSSSQMSAHASDQMSSQTPGQTPQNGASSTGKKNLKKPPARPQLMGPPTRPKPPAPEPSPVTAAAPPPEVPAEPQPIGPIPVPSERMQYRAIGLLKGKYVPSEDQFNRGNIALGDDTLIDSVLLGRVTSLIKKHVDLERAHLWVVYPRTLQTEESEPALHMQIVGVWEPETLRAERSEGDNDDVPKILSSAEAESQCDSFSIRGEIAKYSEESSEIVVNIVQKSKSEKAKPKRPFKLVINGQLSGRTTGYFWNLEVERQGGQLVLKEGTSIAVVPPKKKSKDARRDGGSRKRASGKPRTGGAPKPKPKPKVASDEPVAQSPAVEQPPVEQPPVEQPLEEKSISQKPLAEQPSTEHLPVDTAPRADTVPETATQPENPEAASG
ncbi:MAG: hypothetical protein WBC73_12520 [Phormidesmis sp.]